MEFATIHMLRPELHMNSWNNILGWPESVWSGKKVFGVGVLFWLE